jgi:threonine/homoserine/homoserine lactone efflux protein
MSLATWLAFLLASTVLALVPGPTAGVVSMGVATVAPGRK